jgi:hypothetical protein
MVDIDDMYKTNELFRKKLKGLAELTEYGNGKLGIYENATYVSWNYFQGLQRRFYGESIDTLIPFLKTTLDDYCIFYNMILFFIMIYCYNNKMNISGNTMLEYSSDTTMDDMVKSNTSVKISEEEKEQLVILQKENKLFMDKLYNGLIILKMQYDANNGNQESITLLINKIHDLSILFSIPI